MQTGNFSLFPRYAAEGRPITAGRARPNCVVEGRDMAAIGAARGPHPDDDVARVGYRLSREAREKVEADVGGRGDRAFRAKAAAYAKAVRLRRLTVREVKVMHQRAAERADADVAALARESAHGRRALPVEAGKATVTATVSGSVQMK